MIVLTVFTMFVDVFCLPHRGGRGVGQLVKYPGSHELILDPGGARDARPLLVWFYFQFVIVAER